MARERHTFARFGHHCPWRFSPEILPWGRRRLRRGLTAGPRRPLLRCGGGSSGGVSTAAVARRLRNGGRETGQVAGSKFEEDDGARVTGKDGVRLQRLTGGPRQRRPPLTGAGRYG